MNGDALELAGMIQKVEQNLSAKLDSLNTFKGNIEARVEAVEEEQKTAERRQWIHSAVILPLLALLHAVARHFGVNV